MQMFFCEFCEIFKNSFFYRTPPLAASVLWVILNLLEVQLTQLYQLRLLNVLISCSHLSKVN